MNGGRQPFAAAEGEHALARIDARRRAARQFGFSHRLPVRPEELDAAVGHRILRRRSMHAIAEVDGDRMLGRMVDRRRYLDLRAVLHHVAEGMGDSVAQELREGAGARHRLARDDDERGEDHVDRLSARPVVHQDERPVAV